MEKFYVAHDGKQKGPWSLDVISEMLSEKDLEWNDYIYDKKLEDWVLLLEFPKLTKLFNSSFKTPIADSEKVKAAIDPEADRAWYILKQNNNYGPFSKREMVQMLQSKTLFEYDFIWKKDQDSWKRLSDVEAFNADQIKLIYKAWSPDRDGELFYRRRHARANYDSSLIVHDHKKVYKAQSLEISAGGAGLTMENTDFPIDQELYLHFRPSELVPAFNVVCKIISKYGGKYGVQFTQISAAAKDSIDKFAKKAA